MILATTPTKSAQELNIISDSTSMLSEQAQVVLGHRYFLKDEDSTIIEDGDGLFTRVAKAVASIDATYYALPVEADLLANDFFAMMSNLQFLPNSLKDFLTSELSSIRILILFEYCLKLAR